MEVERIMGRYSILVDCSHGIVAAGLRAFINQSTRLAACGSAPGTAPHLILYAHAPGDDLSHLAWLQRAHPDVPVLALVFDDDREVRRGCISAGVAAILTPGAPATSVERKCLRLIEGEDCGPATGDGPPFDNHLTLRELAVLDLLTSGYTNRQIALSLAVSEHTVRAHMRGIMMKMNVTNRVQAATLALRPRLQGGAVS
jgi:DNA-binding NarL/FixJ family response regulator